MFADLWPLVREVGCDRQTTHANAGFQPGNVEGTRSPQQSTHKYAGNSNVLDTCIVSLGLGNKPHSGSGRSSDCCYFYALTNPATPVRLWVIRFAKHTCDLPGTSRSGAGKVAGANNAGTILVYSRSCLLWIRSAHSDLGFLWGYKSQSRCLDVQMAGITWSGTVDAHFRLWLVCNLPMFVRRKETVRGS